jgi:hypothetical protein
VEVAVRWIRDANELSAESVLKNDCLKKRNRIGCSTHNSLELCIRDVPG